MSIPNPLRSCRWPWMPVFLILLLPTITWAEVVHVPADQPTIQAGINAAGYGDTVLVADGVYQGSGNRDIDFHGRAITVRSVHGPENCIIDCGGAENKQHRGFIFQNGEGRDSVLQGFTIRNGDMGVYGYGGGIEIINSSPSILDNVITANRAWLGGGIDASGSPLIAGNLITGNLALDYDGLNGAGGGVLVSFGVEMYDNVISFNVTGTTGGGVMVLGGDNTVLGNNLIVGNQVDMIAATTTAPGGAGVACDGSTVTIFNCTIAWNTCHSYAYYYYSYGGGVCLESPTWWNPGVASEVTIIDSIIYGNDADVGRQCYIGSTHTESASLAIAFSNVEEGQAGIEGNDTLTWGPGMIDADPLFTAGPEGDWYLSHIAAGQAADSPCLDSGSAAAGTICFDDGTGGTRCLHRLTTRSDQVWDGGTVDMGYHYLSDGSVGAALDCVPPSGVLPFPTTMTVRLDNRVADQLRRLAGRIDILLGLGGSVTNWRAGYTNVAGGELYTASWIQNIPALPSLMGDNVFALVTMDVTPPPWNLPPYPPAGDTATDSCLVNGIGP